MLGSVLIWIFGSIHKWFLGCNVYVKNILALTNTSYAPLHQIFLNVIIVLLLLFLTKNFIYDMETIKLRHYQSKGDDKMKLQEAWLKCNIKEGFFPEEFAVSCKNIDNYQFSFFVGKSLINLTTNSVKVNVLDRKENIFLIFLPATPIENLGRTVKVSKDDIEI